MCLKFCDAVIFWQKVDGISKYYVSVLKWLSSIYLWGAPSKHESWFNMIFLVQFMGNFSFINFENKWKMHCITKNFVNLKSWCRRLNLHHQQNEFSLSRMRNAFDLQIANYQVKTVICLLSQKLQALQKCYQCLPLPL